MSKLLTRIVISLVFLAGMLPTLQAQEPPTPSGDFALTVREAIATPVQLHWQSPCPIDYFKVLRDGETIAVTATTFYPDAPATPRVTYQIEAWRAGRVIARSIPVAFDVPDRPINDEIPLQPIARRSGVRLSWPASANPDIVAYRLARQESATQGPAVELTTVKARPGSDHVFIDRPAKAGRWIYTIVALNAVGKPGPEMAIEVTWDANRKPEKILDWPLTEKPEGATVTGKVAFTPEGAIFNGGYIQAPHHPAMDMDMGLTVEFEFREDAAQGMPVLLSHGLWRADGWFFQHMGDAFLMRSSVGDSPSFPIEQGRWYTVRMTYGGLGDIAAGDKPLGILSVNGRLMKDASGTPIRTFKVEPELDTGTPPRLISVPRPLIVGQYGAPSANFAFRGVIRNLKIWDEPSSEGFGYAPPMERPDGLPPAVR